MTDLDKKEISNEMKIWYGSNNKTFLDSAIEKYHRESTVIEQVCVPIKGQHWSIIDVKVVSDQTEHKNGYVKNTVFAPIIDSSTPDNLEAILNKTIFHQSGGQSILGCTLVRTRLDWLMRCTLVPMMLF